MTAEAISAALAAGEQAASEVEPEAQAETESQPEAKTEAVAAKPDTDPDDAEPTRAERIKFRQKQKQLRDTEKQLAAAREEQDRLMARERSAWQAANAAIRGGDALSALAALGIDPEIVAKQLAAVASGRDPQVDALQRRLAEIEVEREKERQTAAEREREAQYQRDDQRWTSLVTEQLGASEDPIARAMSAEPDLVSAIKELQADYLDRTGNLLPTAKAAKQLARRLDGAKTRLGRLLSAAVETEKPAKEPSVAAPLKRAREDTKPTRTLGAGKTEARTVSGGNGILDVAAWKRKFARELAAATDD